MNGAAFCAAWRVGGAARRDGGERRAASHTDGGLAGGQGKDRVAAAQWGGRAVGAPPCERARAARVTHHVALADKGAWALEDAKARALGAGQSDRQPEGRARLQSQGTRTQARSRTRVWRDADPVNQQAGRATGSTMQHSASQWMPGV